jgi:hypothetical protein
MPLHEKLAQGYSSAIIDRLVRSNWWRTIAWTLRGLSLAVPLIQKIR